MASEGTPIPLLLPKHQEAYQLLELPEELATLLTDSPETPLQLKSYPETETISPHLHDEKSPLSPHAHLCTPSQTYLVKTVNSSNSLHVCRASQPFPSLPNGTFSLISQPTQTLELLPLSNSSRSAMPYLRSLVPLYHPSHSGGCALEIPPSHSLIEKLQKRLFADVPLDEAECLRAWTASFCFATHGSPGNKPKIWRADARMLVRLWPEIKGALVECDNRWEGLNVVWKIGEHRRRFAREGMPVGIFDGVVVRMCGVDAGEMVEDRGAGNAYRFDAVRGASLLGRWSLESLCSEEGGEGHGPQGVPVEEYMKMWGELVEDCGKKWRDAVSLEDIAGHYALSPSNEIRWVDVDGGERAETVGVEASAVKDGEAKGTEAGSKKRKWAEKFKASSSKSSKR